MMKYLYTVLFALCLAAVPLKAQLSIVEIMYNNPGEDLYEYVKVWNVSSQTLNLADYSMASGIEATFPDIELGFNDWFFVVVDSAAFVSAFNTFGYPVVEGTGALNNGGETITIVNSAGQIIDEVSYSDGGGWPTFADGNGSSIHYCGTANQDKNDPSLWSLTPANLGLVINEQPLYGLLGDISFQCNERGVATFFAQSTSVLESDGTINIPLYIDRALQNSVTVTLTDASGTAIAGDDYQLITQSVMSDTDTMDVMNVQVAIADDADLEADETFTVSFEAFTSEYLSLTRNIEVTIIDNDTPLSERLILTGVWDAQPGFSGTKGAEFYALQDIPDLSVFGVGVVNNGNGTDGVEYTFPQQSLTAGSFIYLVEDAVEFEDYFGFTTDFIFPQINVNGDDAIELFENAQPLDVFGEADIDGSGLAWEYLDGWAYRISGTTQDGSMFNEGSWTYGGVDALDGPATNAEANVPFPIGTYSSMAPTVVVANDDSVILPFGTMDGSINVTNNDQIPGEITSLEIITQPASISVSVNTDLTLGYTIPTGFSGTETLVYAVSNDVSTADATVTITVEEQLEYPFLNIGSVTTEDADGVAESNGTVCELIGNVYGVNLSSTGTLFTIIDDNGDGIAVFNNDTDLGYAVAEGDIVSVKGTITQYNGLTEIVADEIVLSGSGATLFDPREVFALDETTESQLVQLPFLSFVDQGQWGGGTSGFNVTMTDGVNDFVIRIDNDVDLFLMPIPSGSDFYKVTGIGGQFDNLAPFDGGYQLLPRSSSDIETGLSAYNVLASKVDIYPNPVVRTLNLTSEENLDVVRITDALGRTMIQLDSPALQTEVDVNGLTKGIYTVQCIKGDAAYSLKLIVQ